ncbi:MAG: alpha-hydroxy-acid oxidizing protein [Faecalibacillus faecis]
MNVNEIREKSRSVIGPYCKSCMMCNGKACSNKIPGPGAKGTGTVAIKNYDAWQKLEVKMDTIASNNEIDTSFELFGKTFKYPVFAGPVGAVSQHYSDLYNDNSFNEVYVNACAKSGIAAFTGDGLNEEIMVHATHYIKENNGIGVPTIKPWDKETCFKKLELAKASKAFAIAMDVDAAGLPYKEEYLQQVEKVLLNLKIIDYAKVPFIVKGIMSVEGAQKAINAGAQGIVVSNHGGRVLDGTPATASVLEEIADQFKGQVKIIVDGGIRSGLDVFKALALGADAVIIARPFVNMIYGNGEQGVEAYVQQLGQELENTMMMTGVSSLKEISKKNIYK